MTIHDNVVKNSSSIIAMEATGGKKLAEFIQTGSFRLHAHREYNGV